jgi:hypothetical protein
VDHSTETGGFYAVVSTVGTLCPRCGDPCDGPGRCPSCWRIIGAIAAESAIDVDEHARHVTSVVARARARRDANFRRAAA